MTTETPESRFVERRSAYRGDEADAAGQPPAEPEAALEPLLAEPEAEAPLVEPEAVADLDELASVEVPEPSFFEIVQPLADQALQFLGEIPLTVDGQRRVLPRWAKHIIDLLGIIEERTRGNLSPAEAKYLDQVLTDLRLRYVRVAR